MRVCVHAYVCKCVHACMYTCVFVCARMLTHSGVCVHKHAHLVNVFVCLSVHCGEDQSTDTMSPALLQHMFT